MKTNGEKKKNRILLSLFLSMLKIGAFTFGGGYAMISLLQNEFVVRKKWLEADEFLDLVAVAESTPGPIAINSSTYIGYKMGGVIGSAVGTLGMCLPSLVIIYVISLVFDAFLSFTVVANAFRGIQACVVFLILSAAFRMAKQLKKSVFGMAVLLCTVVCMVLFSVFAVRFSTVFYILISGFLGWLVWLIGRNRNGKGGEK